MRHRALLVAALLAPAVSLAQSSGWQYASRITVDSGNGAPPHTTTMRHIVTPAALRTEISGPLESYTITNEADSTTIMIMPGSRMATIMPIMRASPAALTMPAMTPHFTVHTTEDLGVGEPILGHATHHYRMTSQGTMEVALEGQTCTRAINDVSEVWTASDVDLKPAVDLVLRHSGSSLAGALGRNSGNIDPDAASRGFPLRSVFRQSVANPAGGTRTITMTIEYTEFSNGPIDNAVFSIPADYRQMDMRRYANRIKADSTVKSFSWKALCNR